MTANQPTPALAAPARSAREFETDMFAPEQAGPKADILLVDDREDKCLAMETILADLGENIVTVHSGKEALRRLLEKDFAVILLDVNMPGLDGFETACLIRQRRRSEHTPIIFVTGINDTETHRSRGYSLGAVDYILTPVLPDVLRTKVSVFVELFKKSQQLLRQTEGLRLARNELELRVRERTLELAAANEKLQSEIAERQRAEENIRQINAVLEHRVLDRTTELAEANQELEAFTYSVAHDLQAPLRNIQSYALLLEEETAGKISTESAQYLRRISVRGKYMQLLITGLLNLSMIGKQELKRQSTELGGLVDEVVASIKSEIVGRQIEWRIRPLPSAPCDANLMKQVFTNLLSNAAKYTTPQAEAVIEVGQIKMNGENPIYVRDNGVGFNMKNAGKLFGVFQRLHPAGEFEGTGIGLATVARIIGKHGGRIWAEAEEKKGATFYFTLGQAQKSND